MIIVRTGQFKKDFKLAHKRGKDLSILRNVLEKLVAGQKIEEKYRDHKLTGRLGKYRELHLQPDLLLIYQINKNADELILVRIGSHSELFR